MQLVDAMTLFPTRETCLAHLEALRFIDGAFCPKCGSEDVAKKRDGKRVGRWNCHNCRVSFNVLAGTMFQGTKIPLQKWFLAIAIMVNAKKSVSSYQLARDLRMNQSSAWYMQQRIRAEMGRRQQTITLQGIVEADETYIGGKKRKPNKREDDPPGGQGVHDKTPVLAAVERGGDVLAEVTPEVTGNAVIKFLRRRIDVEKTFLISDEAQVYKAARALVPSVAINHRVQFVAGAVHTNTVEGFFGLLKRAWYGTHHHYTERWMPLFVAEASWKYNHRKSGNAFNELIQGAVTV